MAEGLIEREIDGKVYEFAKWGAEDSLKTLLKLAKIAGKPLGLALGALQGEGGLFGQEIPKDLLGTIFESLTNNLDEDLCVTLIKKISAGEQVLCDGKKVVFNTHYQDKLPHLFKVVKAGLEVQYDSFFGALPLVSGARRPIINRVS